MIIESETDYRDAMLRLYELYELYDADLNYHDLNHDVALEFNELLEAIMAYKNEHYPMVPCRWNQVQRSTKAARRSRPSEDSVSEMQEWHDFDPDC